MTLTQCQVVTLPLFELASSDFKPWSVTNDGALWLTGMIHLLLLEMPVVTLSFNTEKGNKGLVSYFALSATPELRLLYVRINCRRI